MEQLQENTIVELPYVSSKEARAVKMFWFGFIIFTAGYTITKGLPGNILRWYMVQGIGLLFCIPAAMNLISLRLNNGYLKNLHILYCIWLCVVIMRGISFNYADLRTLLFDAEYGLLIYFVPVVLWFPKKIAHLTRVFDTIAILSIIYIAYCLMFRGPLLNPEDDDIGTGQGLIENFSKTLSVPSGFILLTYIYHSNKRKLLALFVVGMTLLLALIRARRGLLFMEVSYLFFTYVIFCYINRQKRSILLISVLILGLVAFAGVKLYNQKQKGVLTSISERADQDTRTQVEVCYYDDMQTKDWIIGRGLKGEYFCPAVDKDFSNYRSVIETDYLNIILKGGLISLVLLLLITIPAMIKGIFYSENTLSKAAGIWILLWLIDLYPTTVYTFTLNHMLVWICVGICYSKSIRYMPETTIKAIFSR